jgi:hypothetical protein
MSKLGGPKLWAVIITLARDNGNLPLHRSLAAVEVKLEAMANVVVLHRDAGLG